MFLSVHVLSNSLNYSTFSSEKSYLDHSFDTENRSKYYNTHELWTQLDKKPLRGTDQNKQ